MTELEILALLVKAKEFGINMDEVRALKERANVPRETHEPTAAQLAEIARVTAENEMTDEEMLYWATPKYDQIQAEKEAIKKGKQAREDLNG